MISSNGEPNDYFPAPSAVTQPGGNTLAEIQALPESNIFWKHLRGISNVVAASSN
jgi:hypothetical protein